MKNILKTTLVQTDAKHILIEVFGLGYVGFPLSVRLASSGYAVCGIDVNKSRIKLLENNELHESELFLKELFLESKKNNNFLLSDKSSNTSKQKIGIICVPTPIPHEGIRSDIYVNSAVNDFLSTAKKGDIIIIESSIEVGTTDNVKKIIKDAGFIVGHDFGLVFCPERIDPQNRKWNLENIPRVIYCSDDLTFEIAKKIYYYVNNSNLTRVSQPKIAETVKSFENTFRLVNISLVNELAILCDHLKINVNEVIEAAKTKPFGFMPFYPGAGAGGHCIPKDPVFLLDSSKKFGSKFNTISNALKINSFMSEYIGNSINKILEENNLPKKVLICGMSYKPDIEDMRDSPGFKILKNFLHRKYVCSCFDPYFKSELLKKYIIENHMKMSKFDVITSLDDKKITSFSCLCVVQHHYKTKFRLDEIYKKSLIPMIYDCQNRLSFDPYSSTILKYLGG